MEAEAHEFPQKIAGARCGADRGRCGRAWKSYAGKNWIPLSRSGAVYGSRINRYTQSQHKSYRVFADSLARELKELPEKEEQERMSAAVICACSTCSRLKHRACRHHIGESKQRGSKQAIAALTNHFVIG